jgi:GT2 family glycosyltransferase
MNPSVLAVVLNWRQPATTLQCVQTLQRMSGPPADILVIDNGSGDDSVELLHRHSGIRVLVLAENAGFAGGNNRGMRIAIDEGYAYCLLVNNDAFAAPDMLARLLEEVDDNIGLLSPKIYFESDPGRLWFAGGKRQPLTLDLRDTGQGQLDGPPWLESRDVDYLLGTCLLVNLAAAGDVGLLDEHYFFYYEDLDWSIRFQQAGYRLRLVAPAHLYHRVAVSTGGLADSPQRRYYLARGSAVFWRRHHRLGFWPAIVLMRLLSATKMVSRLILAGRAETARAYLRGLRDGWLRNNQSRSTTGSGAS